MEKGKLHKAAKDSSKRGRQVSGAWEAAGQPSRAGWEQPGPSGRSLTHALLTADAGALRHAGPQQKRQSRQ